MALLDSRFIRSAGNVSLVLGFIYGFAAELEGV